MPSTVSSKNTNDLGIKHMKDLYSEHYKTLLKAVKENLQMERYRLLFFICVDSAFVDSHTL